MIKIVYDSDYETADVEIASVGSNNAPLSNGFHELLDNL